MAAPGAQLQHQTLDPGLPAGPVTVSVHVSQFFATKTGTLWRALISPAGAELWLGRGALINGPGAEFVCADGTAGTVLSFHPLEQLRLLCHAGVGPDALVELDLFPQADGTLLRLWHENVPSDVAAGLRARWQLRLQELAEAVASATAAD